MPTVLAKRDTDHLTLNQRQGQAIAPELQLPPHGRWREPPLPLGMLPCSAALPFSLCLLLATEKERQDAQRQGAAPDKPRTLPDGKPLTEEPDGALRVDHIQRYKGWSVRNGEECSIA